jgi:prepilin-type N-terminal cleavage/methylation domain-containing protein
MKIQITTKKSGFTLIELLVAMAITTIIVTVLVSITALSLDTWNRSRSEIRAARQGKAMIDSMAQDLESLVLRKGNSFEWLNAQSKPSTEGPNGRPSPNAIDFFFFSAATDRYNGQIGVANVDMGGDVSSIAYQLRYKDPISNGTDDKFKTFVLYRKIVNPDRTFTSLLGQTNSIQPS